MPVFSFSHYYRNSRNITLRRNFIKMFFYNFLGFRVRGILGKVGKKLVLYSFKIPALLRKIIASKDEGQFPRPPKKVGGGVEHDTKRLCLICAFCT